MSTRTLNLSFLALLGCLALSFFITWRIGFFATDDAYIFFRIADNLAVHGRMLYNLSDAPVNAATSPFYVILLAALKVLGIATPLSGMILSILGLSAALFCLIMLTQRAGRLEAGIAISLLLAQFSWLPMSYGLETPLVFGFICMALLLSDYGRRYWATVFCALAVMTRPDALIFVGLIVVIDTVRNREVPWRELLTGALLCAPLFLFLYSQFGSILPDTLTAKRAQALSGAWPSFYAEARKWFVTFLTQCPEYWVLLTLALVGLVAGPFGKMRKVWILGVYGLLHALAYSFLHVSFYFWYAVPGMVGFFVLSGCGLAFCLDLIPRVVSRWEAVPTVSASFVLGALSVLGIFRYEHFRSGMVQDGRASAYRQLGGWLSRNTDPAERVGYVEIGYVGYYSGRQIDDEVGLIKKELTPYVLANKFSDIPLFYRSQVYVYSDEFSGWFGASLQAPWFKANYSQIAELNFPPFPHTFRVFRKTAEHFPPLPTLVLAETHSDSTIGPFVASRKVQQEFEAPEDGLSRVGVMFGTYARRNAGVVRFSLLEGTNLVARGEVQASDLVDNQEFPFSFNPIQHSKGKRYHLRVETDNEMEGQSATLWKVSHATYTKSSLTVAGEMLPGASLRYYLYSSG